MGEESDAAFGLMWWCQFIFLEGDGIWDGYRKKKWLDWIDDVAVFFFS